MPSNSSPGDKSNKNRKSPFEAIRNKLRSATSNRENISADTIPKQLFDSNPQEDSDHTNPSAQTTSIDMCIAECKGHEPSDLIECNSCNFQAHAKCINIDDPVSKKVWRRKRCKTMFSDIHLLISEMNHVSRELHELKVTNVGLKINISVLENKLQDTNDEIKCLRTVNSDLIKQAETSNSLLTDLVIKNLELQDLLKQREVSNQLVPNNSTGPILVIGDSLVRNLYSADQNLLTIRTHSGARITVIKDKLENYVKENKTFSSIYIVGGSNDCSLPNISTERIAGDMHGVLTTASKMTNKVYLSSIIPRTDNGPAQLISENANLRLRELCSRNPNWNFVDQDTNFRLEDRGIKKSFLHEDGLHLSQPGSEALIRSFNIPATYRNRRQYANKRNQQNNMVNGNHVAYYPPQMSNTQHAPCMVYQQPPPASQAQRGLVSQGQPQLPVYGSNPYMPAFHTQPFPGYVNQYQAPLMPTFEVNHHPYSNTSSNISWS